MSSFGFARKTKGKFTVQTEKKRTAGRIVNQTMRPSKKRESLDLDRRKQKWRFQPRALQKTVLRV